MQVNEVRKKFIEFFKAKGHTVVASSSLIPHDDPTLLFTNAGMNQFKDVFLGAVKPSYLRATSSQKCVRAGGKHNDLENVGYTARHHTFFEMLGNFSFGDYFKTDALKFAWEFLTNVLNLPKEKLYVTVYHTDNEAFDIWHKDIGLTTDRIIRIGDKEQGGSDNFWQMGDTGPCGPCSEIFYDHGATISGGLPGSANEDGDRYIEIWNCVFMQFNRDEQGVLHKLPKPSVDTGMGLERISAVMQGVHSNYAIDLFVSLIFESSKITECNDLNNVSLKVIADHIRSISFLISDGVIPSNEGRGYVLRRIIRRAIRHGYKLGKRQPFLHQLVSTLVAQMGEFYVELTHNQQKIEQTILQEENKFFQTIDNGMEILESELKNLKNNTLLGDVAFKLYDTYGFPLDLTQDICKEHGINIDISGFYQFMQNQKDMARLATKFKSSTTLEYDGCDTDFIGYESNNVEATVIALYRDNQLVDKLVQGDNGVTILDKTVFYAQGGGQVGDAGLLQMCGADGALFEVDSTKKIRPQVFGHIGKLNAGVLKVGDNVVAMYDLDKRLATARNHSATHLLHKALHNVIGNHALQKGSLVCSEYARFDFAHSKPLTKKEIEEIELIVNHVIMMNYPIVIDLMKYDDAIKIGAVALFGEKYTKDVRVIKMDDFSIELCGGTHVKRTGDIGFFTITGETGIANGVRRIEAVTGEVALLQMQKNMAVLDDLREQLKAQNNVIVMDKVVEVLKINKQLYKQVDELHTKLLMLQADNYLGMAKTLGDNHKLLVLQLDSLDNKSTQSLAEYLKGKLGSAIVVIGCKNLDKANIIVVVSKDLSKQYKAGKIVNYLCELLGGKGGGRDEIANGSGIMVSRLNEVLAKTDEFLKTF